MEDNTTHDRTRSTRRAGLIGGVIGSLGLAATLLAVTATAGATEPTLETPPNTDVAVPTDGTDADLPTDEDWADYDACVNAAFAAAGIDVETDVFEAGEGEFVEGMEGIAVMDFGPAVSVMNGDDLTFADFGEGDGSITITKTGDDISVTSDGDVTVEEVDFEELSGDFDIDLLEGELADGEFEVLDIDDEAFAEIDDALAGCDDKLPEGIDFEDFSDAVLLDEGDLEESGEAMEVLPADVN